MTALTLTVPYIGTKPEKGTPGAAAFDLESATDVVIADGRLALVATRTRVAIPSGHAGLILPRSGWAARLGVTVLNSPGLIDPDYRGVINVILINHGTLPVEISLGDRIAQLLIVPTAPVKFEEATNRAAFGYGTERGENGFGSTGV